MYLATSRSSFLWTALYSQTALFLKTPDDTIRLQRNVPDGEAIERRIEQEDTASRWMTSVTAGCWLERRQLKRIGQRSRRQCQSLRSSCAIIDSDMFSGRRDSDAILILVDLIDERIRLHCRNETPIATPGDRHRLRIRIGWRFELTGGGKQPIVTRREFKFRRHSLVMMPLACGVSRPP